MTSQFFYPILINIARYFLVAGVAFLVFYIIFPNSFKLNKIQNRFAKQKDFYREILQSIQSSIVIGFIISLFLFTPLKQYSAIYQNINDTSILWFPFSIVIAFIFHDAYFYLMHRCIHHPKLYKIIHLVHHKSVIPSPWTSFSFHFFEAFIEALAIPLIVYIIPLHPLALILFGFLSFSMNVYGHLGYEIAPKWFRNSILFEIINTATYHNLHHARFKGNYGLYFRVWDRLFKTEVHSYVKEYDRIQNRRFNTK